MQEGLAFKGPGPPGAFQARWPLREPTWMRRPVPPSSTSPRPRSEAFHQGRPAGRMCVLFFLPTSVLQGTEVQVRGASRWLLTCLWAVGVECLVAGVGRHLLTSMKG